MKMDSIDQFLEMGFDVDSAKLGLEFQQKLKARLPEFLRSLYWTPPYDHRWGVAREEHPSVKIFKEVFPAWDDSMLDMSLYEWIELMGVPDPQKCGMMINAWGNGPHPCWKGMAIPAFGVGELMSYVDGMPVTPVGGMHALAHAMARCAIANGAKIFVNSPVSEVLVEDGQAYGVRVDDNSALQEKTIRANLGVILNMHVKQLPELVTRGSFTPDFIQKIDNLSLKGGSLFVTNFVVNEFPRFAAVPEIDGRPVTSTVLNADTPRLLELMRDVHSFRTHPTDPDHFAGVWYICHGAHDRSRVRGGNGNYVLTLNLQVPAPEDHRDGPDAVNRAKDEIVATLKAQLREYAPNMTEDKFVATFVNTPRDSEIRNMAFVGGNWMGMRESEQEWGQNKPLPELARYRTPVDGLYLCHQTSHPGGLVLMAVPYNLMHILHEDYEAVSKTTPDWWYPSPWHITDKEGAR